LLSRLGSLIFVGPWNAFLLLQESAGLRGARQKLFSTCAIFNAVFSKSDATF